MSMFRKKKENGICPTEVLSTLLKPISKDKTRFCLQDFEMSATLGTGTFGRVRMARHIATGTFYALKILKKSEIIRLKQMEHIKSEVKLLSMIVHPFVVNMIGHFQDDLKLYMILEYVQGGELFSYLRREGRLCDDAAKFYASEIVVAFSYLHSHNIIYRDLKPENLLLTSSGHIKITDFGFAKVVEDRTWTLCGTPEYLAPEIIQSKGHGKSVDWWALGILIFEMVVGYPPFYDENPFGIYQKILAGKIDFPRHIDSKVRDLIKRLLTPDRTKRLGCMKMGSEDVKRHKWFTKIDWAVVLTSQMTAPYVPEVNGPDDYHHFEHYPDSVGNDALPLNGSDKLAFDEFDTF